MRPSFKSPWLWLPTAAVALTFVVQSFGHGTVVSPISRVYAVYQSNPSNPNFQLAANAVAIDGELSYYTWNELSRNIPQAVAAGLPPGFDYSPWIPDGQLASAGRVDPNSTIYPRTYAGLDQVSADWPKTTVAAGETIGIDFYATAPHSPSVWDVWMTKPTWNPTMPLTWDQMEFLDRPTPVLTSNHYTFDLDIPSDRSGHHVLWIAWQRDDPVGEVFISTSDLEITPPDAQYPGTDEDFILSSGANGVLSSTPPADAKSVAVGNTWTVELSSPSGSFTGQPSFLLARAMTPGEVLTTLPGYPGIFLDPANSQHIIQTNNLPAAGASVTYNLPASAVGRRFAFQGAVSSISALNGSYASTDVHVLTIIP